MRNPERKLIIKTTIELSTAIIVTALILTIFSLPLLGLPSLGELLFPGDGLWNVPGERQSERLFIDGMTDEVTVIRDEWGIPHVYAKKDIDMFFVQGYLHAQDRFFQMDLIRRQVRGQLSEVLGDSLLSSDKFYLATGMEYWANKTDHFMREKYLEGNETFQFYNLFEEYVKGINYYLNTHKNQKPTEYYLLNFEPAPWSTLDTLCLVQEMARQLSWNYNDLYRYKALDAIGKDNFTELFSPFRPYQIPICPDYGSYPDAPKLSTSHNSKESQLKNTIDDFLYGVNEIDTEQRLIESQDITGSNNWVINGSKSSTGLPILCNDMHLAWILPGVWYEQHLISEESNFNSYGFAIPGMPLAAVGHNERVAWGFTNTGYDVLDWYYFNKLNDTHYSYKNEAREFNTRTYSIDINGEESEEFTVRETLHGPVMNDFLGGRIPSNLSSTNLVISSKWTGNSIFLNLIAGQGFHQSQNRNDFDEASQYWHTLAQNIVYADVDGNIGIRPTGKVPIRDDSSLPPGHLGNGSLPYNGSKGEGEWIGFVPFEDLPHSENPEQEYLVSANQIVAGPNYNYSKYFLQNGYANGYRARRINELLNNTDNITIEKMKEYQLDVTSSAAKAFIPTFIDVVEYEYGSNIPSKLNNSLQIMKNWDYLMDKDLVAPSIYRKWRDYFSDYTFDDEKAIYGLDSTPQIVTLEYLMKEKEDSHWFDNKTSTGVTETRNQTILLAFNSTIEWLTNQFGSLNPESWIWGDLHQVCFTHLADLSVFNRGPYSADGEGYTVNPSGVSLGDSISCARGGASERLIVDLSNLNNSVSVIPSGQYGQSHLSHYSDQLEELFLQGKYHPQYFTNTVTNFPSIDVILQFNPKGGMF
ncbi:MAG: hypothetical protein GF311_07090 [Candidatus Lokiarchaeota archaeon]|nr:hypothetical protein [Candidatus Lokiarchaeota archaeon]